MSVTVPGRIMVGTPSSINLEMMMICVWEDSHTARDDGNEQAEKFEDDIALFIFTPRASMYPCTRALARE